MWKLQSLTALIFVGVLLPVGPVQAARGFTTLHQFSGGGDGGNPLAGLTFDPAGNLYGAVAGSAMLGNGAIFKLTPPVAGGSAWNETVLYRFAGGADGAHPTAALAMDKAGDLYGTTAAGGSLDNGMVFELKPPTGGNATWIKTELYAFPTAHGSYVQPGMVLDAAGNLYGTAITGTNTDCLSTACGEVFKLTRPAIGKKRWVKSVLFAFKSKRRGSLPQGTLIFDGVGNLFGTTQIGGSGCFFGCGVVFKLAPPARGRLAWTETVLYSFTGLADGASPSAGLAIDSVGNLYGTTVSGGSGGCALLVILNGCGTVFKLSPPAAGKTAWTETMLHEFVGSEGANPQAGVVFDAAGNLFGTTQFGGSPIPSTVYELVPPGPGKTAWKKIILHRFPTTNTAPISLGPQAGVILDQAGNIYGTTPNGGAAHDGIVFKLTR